MARYDIGDKAKSRWSPVQTWVLHFLSKTIPPPDLPLTFNSNQTRSQADISANERALYKLRILIQCATKRLPKPLNQKYLYEIGTCDLGSCWTVVSTRFVNKTTVLRMSAWK